MRRILIYQRDLQWFHSAASGADSVVHKSALDAANAACEYGNTLRGEALGYVIRLQTLLKGDDGLITLHTRVFSED